MLKPSKYFWFDQNRSFPSWFYDERNKAEKANINWRPWTIRLHMHPDYTFDFTIFNESMPNGQLDYNDLRFENPYNTAAVICKTLLDLTHSGKYRFMSIQERRVYEYKLPDGRIKQHRRHDIHSGDDLETLSASIVKACQRYWGLDVCPMQNWTRDHLNTLMESLQDA